MAAAPSRVTQEMKDALHNLFDQLKWGHNRHLGKALETEIRELIDKCDPKKVSYQLKE